MKRTPPTRVAADPSTTPPCQVEEDFKDVFLPIFEPLPNETKTAFDLRFAFSCAGYRVTKIEEFQSHPVLLLKILQPDAGRITDHRLLLKHIRVLLRKAGLRPKSGELTLARSGRRVLIAFQTAKRTPNFEEILREPHEDLVQDVAMPL